MKVKRKRPVGAVKGAAPRPGNGNARLAAPVPGTRLCAMFEFTSESESTVSLRAGDECICPAGQEDEGAPEWIYVLNSHTGFRGFAPRNYLQPL